MTQEAIVSHIHDYYIGLMGSGNVKLLGIRQDLWGQADRVSPAKCDELALSFLPEKVNMLFFKSSGQA